MRKSVILLLISFAFVASVSAASVTNTTVNSTLMRIAISNANNAYAYEINFSVDSGTTDTPSTSPNRFYPNFSAGAPSNTKGGNQKNGYLYVYESRLDSSQVGYTYSGSTNLFNITHSSGAVITLRGHTLVLGNNTIEYGTYTYTEEGEVIVTTTTSTSSGGGASIPIVTIVNDTNDTRQLTYRESQEITTEPEEFTLNIVQGVEAERELLIRYTGDEALEVEFDADGDMSRAIGFEEEKVILYPGERKIKFGVLVNSKGLKTGNILIIRGNTILKKVPVITNVRSEDFLFDVNLDIPTEFTQIYSGENVISNIELVQVGPQLKVDVVANYIIKDLEGNSYYEDSETFFVLGEKRFSKEFPTVGLNPGKYVVGLEISYPGAFAVASTQFQVLDRGPLGLGKNGPIILTGAAILICVSIIVSVWALKRRKRVKRFRR